MTVFEYLPPDAAPGSNGRLLIVDCGMLLGKTNAPGVDLMLPVAHDYASGRTDFARRPYNLAPTGRELVVEASYALSLLGGDLIANTWIRRDPGHIAALPDDKGAALRFTLGF